MHVLYTVPGQEWHRLLCAAFVLSFHVITAHPPGPEQPFVATMRSNHKPPAFEHKQPRLFCLIHQFPRVVPQSGSDQCSCEMQASWHWLACQGCRLHSKTCKRAPVSISRIHVGSDQVGLLQHIGFWHTSAWVYHSFGLQTELFILNRLYRLLSPSLVLRSAKHLHSLRRLYRLLSPSLLLRSAKHLHGSIIRLGYRQSCTFSGGCFAC